MLQEESTVFRTPRRQRRLIQREGNVGRRRSLFSESREFEDDVATLSPTSSEIGTPSASPVVAVKNLENNFNQLLLNRTPVKSPPGTPVGRVSPKIKGVRCLSENTDVIKTNTFYGGKSFATASVDGKTLFDYVRSAVPLKARTRLFPDDAPKERKKRGRTASFLDSAKRPKKKPRLQESIPCTSKLLVKQKLERLKSKLALERAFKKKKKVISRENLDEMTVYADKKSAKKETQPPVKRKYNWEIFSTGSERQFFRSLNSSVTMTPPSSTNKNKKKKLMSLTQDFLTTPEKLFDTDSEDEETDVLINEIKKDVIAMVQDEDKDVRDEVDNLLLQLDHATEQDVGSDVEGNENNDPNAVPSTPSQCLGTSSLTTPSTQPKLYPVFLKTTPSSGSSSTSSVLQPKKNTPQTLKGVGVNQMLLDCGQSKLREVECPVCQLVYVQGVAEDEEQHKKYHSTVSQMKYTGFKNEMVAGVDGPNKIIMVRKLGSDTRVWNKALEYKDVVDDKLGAPACDVLPEQVYLYIKDKQVVGLLCAVMLSEAHRLLPLSDTLNADPNMPSLCSEESYPAKCGITRLWVSPTARNKGIATAMGNALRRNFMFGTILDLNDIALSSPTADGRIFGSNFFKRNDFLVY